MQMLRRLGGRGIVKGTYCKSGGGKWTKLGKITCLLLCYLDAHGWSDLFHHGDELESFALVSVHIQNQPVTKRNRGNNMLLDSLLAPVGLRTGLKWGASKVNLLQWKLSTFSLEREHKMACSRVYWSLATLKTLYIVVAPNETFFCVCWQTLCMPNLEMAISQDQWNLSLNTHALDCSTSL